MRNPSAVPAFYSSFLQLTDEITDTVGSLRRSSEAPVTVMGRWRKPWRPSVPAVRRSTIVFGCHNSTPCRVPPVMTAVPTGSFCLSFCLSNETPVPILFSTLKKPVRPGLSRMLFSSMRLPGKVAAATAKNAALLTSPGMVNEKAPVGLNGPLRQILLPAWEMSAPKKLSSLSV